MARDIETADIQDEVMVDSVSGGRTENEKQLEQSSLVDDTKKSDFKGNEGSLPEVFGNGTIAASNQSEVPASRTVASVRGFKNSADRQAFLDGLEHRFLERCKVGLHLVENRLQRALQLFRETEPQFITHTSTIGTGSMEETERLWIACVLYAVKMLESKSPTGEEEETQQRGAGYTFSQVLQVTNLSVVEFFKELPQFLARCGASLKAMYGDDWEKRLQVKEAQANYVHLIILLNHYKRVYNDFFFSSDNSETGSPGDKSFSPQMQFGWFLFLSMRMHVLNQFTDLITCTHGLLAVLVFMILHMPVSLRNFTLEDTTKFAKRSPEGINIVASVCNAYQASEEDVQKMLEKAFNMVGVIFKGITGAIPSIATETFQGINTEGLLYFEGLLDDKSISSNLKIIEKDYEMAYYSRGGLDERVLMTDDSFVTSSSCDTPKKTQKPSSPANGSLFSASQVSSGSPCSSPMKIGHLPSSKMPPPTPVTSAMTTALWLRTVIAPLSPEPSAELRQFFKSCERDICNDIVYRAQVLLEGIFPGRGMGERKIVGGMEGVEMMDSSWAEERRLEALKLYYRVLCAMCKKESERLHSTNLTALLTNERFHRCMIACSAELVLTSHKTVTMTFPAVLEPTGITAFDLTKIIESFVRNEETLPRELKRHLNNIEERLLESMAWEKGSSMYNSLIVAKAKLAPEINRLGLLADPMPSLDALIPSSSAQSRHQSSKPSANSDEGLGSTSPERLPAATNSIDVSEHGEKTQLPSFLSPVKERPSAFSAFSCVKRFQPPLQSAFASPQRPSPLGGGETCADAVVNAFFQKVSKVAAIRIKCLCERLQQPSYIIEQVYRLVQHALYHITGIFFRRHIDQIILCSIYGVCKVNNKNLTFKEIIYQYRKHPQCKAYVFRNVFIEPRHGGQKSSHETGDIIKFYNDVFVPATKAVLVNLGPNPASSAQGNSCISRDDEKPEGHTPASPKPSLPFPSLPDMSPKKVSAKHNVYVSPLRSTKVDNLLSPHSRSLYACVGESTHAYQSPSKDLTAINNRLNNRTIGRLDFNDVAMSQWPWTSAPAQSPPMKRPRLDR